MSRIIFMVYAIVLGGCCTQIKMVDDVEKGIQTPDLPDQIYFRTATETFNRRYFLALRDGRIWFKERKKGKKWHLLGRTGVPEGCRLKRFDPPKKIIAISADGVHLTALSEKGIFYRGTNLQNDPDDRFHWQDEWGWPAGGGPGLKISDLKNSWSVSDSHPFNIKYYRDGNGKKHSVGFGVAHLYMAGNDGYSLHFNDWWLPADWSREICLPDRGKFRVLNLSASGSTIMIINRSGEIYTQMYDFDIEGENPLLTYTFVDQKPAKHVRKLPMPGWKKHPVITDGKITSTITIFQTGKGNKTRELRVEGIKDGKTGFYYKNIDQHQWQFQVTNRPTTAPLINIYRQVDEIKPLKQDRCYSGTIKKKKSAVLNIKISNFNAICSPAIVTLLHNRQPVIVNGKPLTLQIHHRHTLVKKIRKDDYWKRGKKASIRGAIVISKAFQEQIKKVSDETLKKQLKSYFKGLKVINFHGTASLKTIKLKELTIWDLFRAPMEEKGNSMRYEIKLRSCE